MNINRAFEPRKPNTPYSERLDEALGERDAYIELYARAVVERNWLRIAVAVLLIVIVYLRWF